MLYQFACNYNKVTFNFIHQTRQIRQMDRWEGKVAVVTGASSGIGLAIAKALLQHGLIVVGLARRRSKMENDMKDVNGKGDFYALECDLTNEEQVNDAFQWIKKNLKTIHILINNAGTLEVGKTPDVPFRELKRILDLNFTALLLCTKLAIDLMKEGGEESHIIMMNSVAGHRINTTPSVESTNIYAATKFAVKALSQTLEKELYGENIRITNVSPGAVKTELTDSVSKQIPILAQLDKLNSEDIADAVVHVIGTKSNIVIEELTIKPSKAPY